MTDASLPELHARALDRTAAVMAGVRTEQLDAASVCDGWDVRTLVHHIVYGNWWVPELVGGKTIEEVGDRLEGDLLGDDLAAAYRASADAAAAAFREPGAMERPVAVSYGPVPGAVYCRHRIVDVVVHGWDVAKSTGQPTDIDPELVAACWELIQPDLEMLAGSGAFGSGVDLGPDTDPQVRLLAQLGRTA